MPDVNGDGLGDIVGRRAPRTLASPERPRLVVVQGASSSTDARRYTIRSLPTDPDTFGQQVVVVPDMNGDGLAEIATSACVRTPGMGCERPPSWCTRGRATELPELARLTPGSWECASAPRWRVWAT